MPVHDDLGIRMKEFYESVPKTRLVRRMPVAVRIDGKAFHTFTRGFNKPFDDILIKSMQETTKYLCENIQGCVLGYTQSDEITLILVDYQKLTSSAWFDYEVQKMCSISASMATMAFNKAFEKNVKNFQNSYGYPHVNCVKYKDLINTYVKAVNKGAMFDARCFNIPKEEVANLIYWRQLDATRNSIQMVGQANFSHKELQNKSCNDIQDMLMTQKGINWNDFPVHKKRGTCIIKTDKKEKTFTENIGDNGDILGTIMTIRSKWIIDENIPIFKGEDRNYIEKLIYF